MKYLAAFVCVLLLALPAAAAELTCFLGPNDTCFGFSNATRNMYVAEDEVFDMEVYMNKCIGAGYDFTIEWDPEALDLTAFTTGDDIANETTTNRTWGVGSNETPDGILYVSMFSALGCSESVEDQCDSWPDAEWEIFTLTFTAVGDYEDSTTVEFTEVWIDENVCSFVLSDGFVRIDSR